MTRKKLAKDAKLGAEIENDWKFKAEEENWAPDEDLPTKVEMKKQEVV